MEDRRSNALTLALSHEGEGKKEAFSVAKWRRSLRTGAWFVRGDPVCEMNVADAGKQTFERAVHHVVPNLEKKSKSGKFLANSGDGGGGFRLLPSTECGAAW
jgi:hypothetical protein